MSYAVNAECHGAVMDSCTPWTPRHCERCGACEAVVRSLYRPDGEGGTYRDKNPRLLCWSCYDAGRPPVALTLGLGA